MVDVAIYSPETKFGVQYLFEVQSRYLRANFSKISGIKEEIEVVDMRDGLDPLQLRKIPGPHGGSTVTFSRGITNNIFDLAKWFSLVKACAPDFRDDVQVLIGDCAREGVRTIALRRAWPVSYELGELDGRTSGLLIENLILAFETLDFASGAGFD